jgi:hypothetical protein
LVEFQPISPDDETISGQPIVLRKPQEQHQWNCQGKVQKLVVDRSYFYHITKIQPFNQLI